MKYIIKPRGLGKTTDLIELAAANDLPILTATNQGVEYIKVLSRRMGYDVKVYSLYDIKTNKTRGLINKEILVDETDSVFKELLKDYGFNPILGTLTIEG